MSARKRTAKPPQKHAINEDPDVPANLRGERFCRRCKHMGKPGDLRHTEQFPPAPDEDRSDQILGEAS